MIHQILVVNVDVVTFSSTKSFSVKVSDVVRVEVVMVDVASHSSIGRPVMSSVPALVPIIMMMMTMSVANTISGQVVPVSSDPSALPVPTTTISASSPSAADLALSASRSVVASCIAITTFLNPSALSVPATRIRSSSPRATNFPVPASRFVDNAMTAVVMLLDKLALSELAITTISAMSTPMPANFAVPFSTAQSFPSNGLATATITSAANLAGTEVELAAALTLELSEARVDLGKLAKVDALLIISS